MKHCVMLIAGGGYAKLKERQGSKELLDPSTASANKMSPDGADEGLLAEQSSATPGRQSVGLLAGTARLVKRAVATADRYKQFIDADVDAEAAPIASSDCDADGHSDESSDVNESHHSQPDLQYTGLDDTGHHAVKLPVPSTAGTAATTTTHQPAIQSTKVGVDNVHDKCAVRQRPARPDLSGHTVSSMNPFSLCKIIPPLSCNAGSSAAPSSSSAGCDRVDVFGAAPFRRKMSGPTESKTEPSDNTGDLDVFANVPFVRQQERVAKAASSVSPPATSSEVATVPYPALSSDTSTCNTFLPSESYKAGNVYVTSSGIFHQTCSGPMTASFVPTEGVSGGVPVSIVSTLSSAIQPYGVDMQEMSAYSQQDSGPLLTSPPLSVAVKSPYAIRSGIVSAESLDPLSSSSKASSYLPSDTGPSVHEEPQASEDSHGTGSLKRGWLAKLRNDKESPTTAVANLGFSDDPDAILPSGIPYATDLSFHEDMLDAMIEQKSPVMAGESNFLLPSGEGSHTLPKVGVKKHLSHQHRLPPMPPETDSFSVTKKGIALL